MWVFLLAGIEVVISAVVLATCNFLFIRIKSSALEDKLESITVTDDAKTEVCHKPSEISEQEEKGARQGQEKETNEKVIKKEEEIHKERVKEDRPESETVDSKAVERFLKEQRQNGDMAISPETCL